MGSRRYYFLFISIDYVTQDSGMPLATAFAKRVGMMAIARSDGSAKMDQPALSVAVEGRIVPIRIVGPSIEARMRGGIR